MDWFWPGFVLNNRLCDEILSWCWISFSKKVKVKLKKWAEGILCYFWHFFWNFCFWPMKRLFLDTCDSVHFIIITILYRPWNKSSVLSPNETQLYQKYIIQIGNHLNFVPVLRLVCKFLISILFTSWLATFWSWQRGVVVITTARLYSTSPELSFCAGSNPAYSV